MFSIFVFALCFAIGYSVNSKEECKCFEEFHPEKDGNNWICRGDKHYRIFSCGEEKPPRCICHSADGRDVTLDLGETNCAGAEVTYKSLFCDPKSEWDRYFKNHPHRRLIVEPW